MGARKKLNQANFAGCLLIAAFAGGLTGSWWVFIITAAILLALNLHSGDIRLGKRR